MSLEKIGPYEIVKWAINEKTKQEVAIKIISKKNLLLDSTNMDRVRREIAIQKLINHPNVVKIFDVYETEKHLFLVLEYVSGGELFDYIIECGRVDSSQSREFFQQIIYGLEHFHSFSISHRDLKPENLLLDKDNNIKIADFGMAKMMETGGLLQTACGSPHYVSPEIIRGRGYDGRKSDIWSCGVILYALLCGMLPFNQKDYKELLYNIRRGVFSFPNYLGELEKDIISKMLVVDPEKRITIKGIKRHPWFTFNFPKNYLPPSPPIDYGKGLEKPILLKNIDYKIVQDLSLLGLMNSKEIIKQLQSDQKNPIKIFYRFYEKHSNHQTKNENDEDKSVKHKKERKKSLPMKKRRNSLNKSRLLSPTKKKQRKKKEQKTKNQQTTGENYESSESVWIKKTNTNSKNMKSAKILHLKELIEKTEKQNDLEMSEFSEIMNKSKIFEGKKGGEKNNKENCRLLDYEKKLIKKNSFRQKSVKGLSHISWTGQKMNKMLDKIEPNEQAKSNEIDYGGSKLNKSDPIRISNRKSNKNNGGSSNLHSIRTKSRTRSIGGIRSLSTRNRNKVFNLRSPLNFKKFKFNSFKMKKKKKKKLHTDKARNEKKAKKKKQEKIDNLELSLDLDLEFEEDYLKKGFEDLKKQNNPFESSKNTRNETNTDYEFNMVGSPLFHRTSNQNQNMETILSPRQEDIGSNEKGWFDHLVSKKEQKKLNHKLKRQLKQAKKGLMKQLKENQNIPVFICQNRIIALSSANSVLDLIVELQTALTICNYTWSYPNRNTLKGEIGKLEIKVQIIEKDLNSILDLITINMVDSIDQKSFQKKINKKKKSNTDNKQYLNKELEMFEIKNLVKKNLNEMNLIGKRKWKLAIEFVWKTGSAKKFMEECENLIRFLSQ
ncbi:protein kinase [Anaeramoeba flamelloides]|uniref:Protein kinase n=1 Tax=Anaeramoeba flamelloides TaxID=1746091 RepID=A0AAV7YHR7_9EUKA|nr:protein kinase [Anaeramoeba flamelloides]